MIEQLLSQKIGAMHLELAQQVALVEQLKRELAAEKARADIAEKKLSELSGQMQQEADHAIDRAA